MILVTGANGTTGSEVVRQLAAAGRPVRALVRSRANAAALPKAGVELALGSFADSASIDAAMKGVEAVYMISFEAPDQLALQANLIEAARRAGVRMVARLSASSADADSEDPLIATHGKGDLQLARSGLGHVLIRPQWFDQNFLTYCPGGRLRLPAGEARLPFVDVRDIAAVAIKALTEPGHDGKAYVLTGPEALSHGDVVAILSEATGKPFVYEDIPAGSYRRQLIAEGMTEFRADLVLGLFDRMKKRGTAPVSGDIAKVLGRPAIAFRQFARDYAAEIAKQVA
ncbi:nucleotide-diphosphate-sugar epimerase [Hypericibacter adhaerens]|uniref:Nucleotide-diphosphate-sugar epimerase n=1 Tax=Hypericibacter adhaerens TaxID=2602016 RepID=A0A5J6N5K1_9PROT|nr:SDR family oxidoreductase [Hypericibacter adhaerens]QEX24155.1 nucleotide-diphosphate-sugar epimerase [Hypericibacter adhaerens]